MVKRKIWMILWGLAVLFFFVNINVVRAAGEGTCNCTQKLNGYKVTDYYIGDSCSTNYAPNWYKSGAMTGCGCNCQTQGSFEELQVDSSITVHKTKVSADKGNCECRIVSSGLSTSFNIYNNCGMGYEPEPGEKSGYNVCSCNCKLTGTVIPYMGSGKINYTDQGSTYDPFAGCSNTSVSTSLGCVPVEVKSFVPWLLNILFGIAGGIAFLLMVYGFILIATSGGEEKKMAGAKETITSAIVGLLVCIFSIFILRLITVNILKIPGI